MPPHAADKKLPRLHRYLSELDASEWTHAFRQAVNSVDQSAGPYLAFEERVSWGWVKWGFDATYSYTVPRPDQAEDGQVWVDSIVAIRPQLSRQAARTVRLATDTRRTDLHGYSVPTNTVYPLVGGGVIGIAAGTGASVLTPISPIGLVAGVIAGVATSAGLRWSWIRQGRSHLAVWTAATTSSVDVPDSLAAIHDARDRLDYISRYTDPKVVQTIRVKLDQFRWELIAQPDPTVPWLDDVQDTIDAIGDLEDTCHDIERSYQITRRWAHADDQAARAAAWEQLTPLAPDLPSSARGDGTPELIRGLTYGLREIHHLDTNPEQ